MTTMNTTGLSLARSFLFVPANRPERYAKALASGAGAVIIDLEDAVPADAKPAARRQLADGFARLSAGERSRLLVRINASGTPWKRRYRRLHQPPPSPTTHWPGNPCGGGLWHACSTP